MKQNNWEAILKATLIVGSLHLDIIAAFLNNYLSFKLMPDKTLQFIASGIFGTEAFLGGTRMVLFGLVFHFLIVFLFTVVFFWICDRISF